MSNDNETPASVNYERPNYSELTIGEARKLAKEMSVPLEKTAKLEDIRRLLQDVANGTVTAPEIDPNDYDNPLYIPPPGMAVITLSRTANAGSSRRQAYVSVNGYRTLVPRGRKVLVPIKVVEVLQNSTMTIVTEDENKKLNDRDRYVIEDVECNPVQVWKWTPGEPPAKYDGGEAMAKRIMRPRQKFFDQFQYWPSTAELKEAIKDGKIK